MRNIYIGIGVILIVIVGIFVFVQNKNKPETSSTTSTSTNTTTDNSSSTVASDEVTITYTDSGFDPSSATLKTGGKLTITNKSSSSIAFNSDPHPIHTSNSELNIGTVQAGESKSVTLNKTGTWGYHNHFDSSQTGKIIVK